MPLRSLRLAAACLALVASSACSDVTSPSSLDVRPKTNTGTSGGGSSSSTNEEPCRNGSTRTTIDGVAQKCENGVWVSGGMGSGG